MIKLNKINKYYNRNTRHENHVINDVSLTLPKTGFICLLGESGSGKTTLLNCIGRLDAFASGSIEIEDKSYGGRVNTAAERLRNSRFAYVFQNYFLIREQTVYDNLHLALGSYELSEEEKEARIDYVLEAVDIKRYKKRAVSMLSGGQQQRVAIARALVKSPEVIFADEPTGNLDEANTVRIMNILKKISENCLVLLATHEKRIAEFYADRIITVSDGKIISDRAAENQTELIRFDDNNIYLEEYKSYSLSNGASSIDYYSNEDDEIKLTIVHEGGNLYITAPNHLRVERIDAKSSVQIKPGKRPVYNMEELDKEKFELPKIESNCTNRLKFKRLISMAKTGISTMGGKLVVPIIAMLLTAILCMFAVIDYVTLSTIELSDFIKTDSRLLNITFSKGDFLEANEVKIYASRVKEELVEYCDSEGINYMIYPMYSVTTSFSLDGFYQVKELTTELMNFTYVPISLMQKDALIMGRMPKTPTEVIVDKWVLEAFLEEKNAVAQSMTGVKDFLNRELTIDSTSLSYEIVGICDSSQPAIYIDDVAGMSFCRAGVNLATLEMFKKAHPGQFDDIELLDNEVILNTKADNKVGSSYRTPSGVSLDVVGVFSSDYPATIIVNDNTVETIKDSMIEYGIAFTVFTNNKSAIKNFLTKEIDEDIRDSLQIKIEDRYTVSFNNYMSARSVKLNARILVTIMITVISFAVLYVAMRANALQRLREVAVYRLLGIKKSSILALFAIQTFILSLFTTLIGALATAGIIYMLSGIESLEMGFIVTWDATLFTIAVLFVVNILTGIMPIARLLRIPPAQLASKYDL